MATWLSLFLCTPVGIKYVTNEKHFLKFILHLGHLADTFVQTAIS